MTICTHLTGAHPIDENCIHELLKLWAQFNGKQISGVDFAEKILNSKRNLILASENGEIVGFALCEAIYSPLTNSLYMELWALYVTESCRRTGIGRILLKEVEDFTKRSNCRDVHVSADTLPGVFDFYSSCGYTMYAVRMRKEVI